MNMHGKSMRWRYGVLVGAESLDGNTPLDLLEMLHF